MYLGPQSFNDEEISEENIKHFVLKMYGHLQTYAAITVKAEKRMNDLKAY